jgi:tRNA threonylcarbamoyl adenosine modification protein YeaZ
VNSNPQDGTSVKKYGLAFHTATPQLGLAISNFAGDSRCQTWNLGRSLATDLHQHLVEFIGPQTWADLAFIAVAKGPGGFTGTRMGMVTARTLAQQLDIPVFAISTLAAVAWAQPPQPPLSKGGLLSAQLPLASEGLLSAEPPLAKGGLLNTEPPQPPLAKEGLLSAEPPVAKGGLLSAQPPLAKGGLLSAEPPVAKGGLLSIALQMPAQRGQLFGAVYSVNKDSGLTELFPDTVMTAESWQEKLESWENSYQLIEVGSELGWSVSSVLELAYLEWKQGSRPDWSGALPFYGQHPVKGH